MRHSLLILSLAAMAMANAADAMATNAANGDTIVYNLKNYGLKPGANRNNSAAMRKALDKISSARDAATPAIISLPKGEYHFHENGSYKKELYISNHDQDNPKSVAIALENMENVVFDGNGSDLIFHGTMLPVAMVNTKGCELRNFSIDFVKPHIAQAEVAESGPDGISYRLAPWVDYEVKDSVLHITGEGWENVPLAGIAFEPKSRHIVYNTSDIYVGTRGVEETAPGVIKSKSWKSDKLVPGTIVAMRTWGRPTPGIFMSHARDSKLRNVSVHYADGMGLLAQLCENIDMEGFGVCLRGEDDPRYFTTQADATHFSGCKGMIRSVGGLYEGMMDDAINVHGTYLKVVSRPDDSTIVGRYMHGQSYGFDWGFPGDSVVFVKSRTMELIPDTLRIVSIAAADKPDAHGAKEFKIAFDRPVPAGIDPESGAYGVENITWTPEVVFSGNTVRNNRARGALFSTPKKVVAENNFFDHTSGTAILLCGDCNGWYETGACRDVTIRGNRFLNALTNMFQFTNAVISIYPEIPDLAGQTDYFHSGIVIEDNVFETFDAPILYAKSVDGLVFRNNSIKHNSEYKPLHWNKFGFLFDRVRGAEILNNVSDRPLDVKIR